MVRHKFARDTLGFWVFELGGLTVSKFRPMGRRTSCSGLMIRASHNRAETAL